jgi:cytochrome c-type biogenesis protein CcmF
LVAVVSRNRRRYGGYIVHAGIAVLLIGIAASSSFQTNRDVRLKPGQSEDVDGYTVTYKRPTVSVNAEAFTLGAVLVVTKDGKPWGVLNPTRRFFKPTGQPAGTIDSYFQGEATSEVGLKAGLGSDFWTSVEPDISAVQRRVRAADQGFRACIDGDRGTPPECTALAVAMSAAAANPRLRPAALAQIGRLQAATADRIAESYVADGATATFRVIVNPLVTWMWIGGLIALAGALIALWPTRNRRRFVASDAEASKEAKYREIRDAQLDHAAGKLSDEDFAELNAELRSEAVELLDQAEEKRREKSPVP